MSSSVQGLRLEEDEFVIDTGAAASVCPLKVVRWRWPGVRAVKDQGLRLVGVGGRCLHNFGHIWTRVRFAGEAITVKFQVANVDHPTISVGGIR